MVRFRTEMMIVIETMDDAIWNRCDFAGNFAETACISSTTRSQHGTKLNKKLRPLDLRTRTRNVRRKNENESASVFK